MVTKQRRVLAALNRLAELSRLGLLDTPADEALDRLTRLCVASLRVPMAFVSFVDGKRQFFKSCFGLPEPWASRRETPLSYSFCRHVISSGAPLIVPDARSHPLVKASPAIAELGFVSYLGAPLSTPEGVLLGALAVADVVPREWTSSDLAALKELAACVMAEIMRRASCIQPHCMMMDIKNSFATNTAHEFRTPLTAIKGYIEILLDGDVGELSDQQREFLTIVSSNTERLIDTLDRFLESPWLIEGDTPSA